MHTLKSLIFEAFCRQDESNEISTRNKRQRAGIELNKLVEIEENTVKSREKV